MSTRVLWTALAVSLALNLSFVGAWAYSAMTAAETFEADEDPIAALSSHLVLSDAQREGLVALREAARERWRTLSDEGGSLRDTVAEGLSAASFDQAAMQAVVAERMGKRAAVVAATMADLHAYLQTLSAEQRQAFVELTKQRGFLRGLFGARRRAE